MKKLIAALSLIVGTTILIGVPCAEAADPIYVISAHFILLTDEEITIEAGDKEGDRQKIHLGEHVLQLGDELLWNGSPDEWPEELILSSPRVTTRNAGEVQLRAGVSGGIHYFEHASKDCYQLRSLEAGELPGLLLAVTPTQAPPSDDGHPQVDFDFRLHAALIGEREALPGVSLDVGKPTVTVADHSAFMRIQTGTWEIISAHMATSLDGKGRDALVILVRVDEG